MRGNKGFLLIEVIVAVGILTVGLVYVSKAFQSCLQAMAQAARYSVAAHLAQEKFFELAASGDTKTETDGAFNGYPDFNFSVDKDKVDGLQLEEIGVTVSWKYGRKTGSFDLSSYLPAVK